MDEECFENCPAPDMAKNDWNLASDACLCAVHIDKEAYRDVNHGLADKLVNERTLLTELESELRDNKSSN